MNGRNQQQIQNLSFARADLKVEDFDILIRQKGFRVKWEKGMFCPCINKESGQPDYNCPLCKGMGYYYFDPQETRVIVSSLNGRKDQERIGLNEQGSAYITPMSNDNVGFRDRFTFIDVSVKYSEIVVRSDTDLDDLTYKALDVVAIRGMSAFYKRGIDFDLTFEGNIKWITDMTESKYSISYVINPVYVAINPIHELRGTYSMSKGGGLDYFVQLPCQYQIKREDFLQDGDIQI